MAIELAVRLWFSSVVLGASMIISEYPGRAPRDRELLPRQRHVLAAHGTRRHAPRTACRARLIAPIRPLAGHSRLRRSRRRIVACVARGGSPSRGDWGPFAGGSGVSSARGGP